MMTIFHAIAAWIVSNRYALFFAAMLVEGPASTIAAGFAVSLGGMDLIAVLILATLGNLIPDLFFFYLGYWGKDAVLVKYGKYVGIRKDALERAERIIKRHAAKSLVVIKLVPVFGSAGVAAAGSGRMKFRIFFLWGFIMAAALSCFLVFVGYYFGDAAHAAQHYLTIIEFILVASVAVSVGLLYMRHDIAERLMRKLEED